MIVTCVHVHIKDEAVEDFIRACELNHYESVKEPGNLRFDVVQQADDNSRFMLYEAYESEEAAKAHKSTAHYNAWRDAVQDMMAEPRHGVRYRILFPK